MPNRVVAAWCGNCGSATTSSLTTISLRTMARPVSELSSSSRTTGTHSGTEEATISAACPSGIRRSTPATRAGYRAWMSSTDSCISSVSGMVSASLPSSATARCSWARSTSARS